MAYGTVNAEQMTTQSGYTLGAGNASSFKNRIINGAMVIDQRNAGATVAFSGSYVVYLDRWQGRLTSGSGSPTIGQSSTAPAGFVNSLLVTNGTAGTVSAASNNSLFTVIEGYNIADLNWGTANAKTVTLSFWVRSSLTGTFGGSFQNYNNDRSYPFNYTISSANTWEQKTITVAGDTTGTWNTTNSGGIVLWWDLGFGSNYQGTAGAWAAGDKRTASGSTQLVTNASATFYITGVQLEVGSVATGFDYRSYGIETMLCRRYYQKYTANSGSGQTYFISGNVYSSTLVQCPWQGQGVPFRTDPTLTTAGTFTILNGATAYNVTPSAIANTNSDVYGVTSFQVQMSGTSLPTNAFVAVLINSSGAYLGLSAEL